MIIPLPPGPLDVHCKLDDGFSLCGGNKVPCVPHDLFEHLAEVKEKADQSVPKRFPWQRCRACVAMLENAQ